jgi:hypothetical protein
VTQRVSIGAVYHPTVLSSAEWLGKALLYTDQIAVIAPTDDPHDYRHLICGGTSHHCPAATLSPVIAPS